MAQVIGTISRLAPTQAHLQIQISGNHPVPESSEEFTGLIRLADIRLTERDKIKMGECFRLGDLVKAKVVSHVLFLVSSDSPLGVGARLLLRGALTPHEILTVERADPPAIPRRRSQLLPLHGRQRARCHLGPLGNRQRHGPHLVPGHGGPEHRKDREA